MYLSLVHVLASLATAPSVILQPNRLRQFPLLCLVPSRSYSLRDMPHMQLMQTPPKPTDARQTLVRQSRALCQHQTPDLGRVRHDRLNRLVCQLAAAREIEDPEMVKLPHPVRRRMEDLGVVGLEGRRWSTRRGGSGGVRGGGRGGIDGRRGGRKKGCERRDRVGLSRGWEEEGEAGVGEEGARGETELSEVGGVEPELA